MLTPEQTKSIKIQLIEQIMGSFPEDKKDFAISQIEAMDGEQLEEFLKKNNLMKKGGNEHPAGGQCVFCSIIFGDIKSYKIAENSKAIAVLEINPISRGHVIIIPKDHITSEKSLPPQVNILSKRISSLIKSRLKPERVKTSSSNIMGHEIINIIPFYNGEDSNERKHATEEELMELQKILRKKSSTRKVKLSPEKRVIKKVKKVIKEFEEKIWLPKRIP